MLRTHDAETKASQRAGCLEVKDGPWHAALLSLRMLAWSRGSPRVPGCHCLQKLSIVAIIAKLNIIKR